MKSYILVKVIFQEKVLIFVYYTFNWIHTNKLVFFFLKGETNSVPLLAPFKEVMDS